MGVRSRIRGAATRAWLAGGQAGSRRWRIGFDRKPHRQRLIERLAPGNSFLDLGGMWGMHGEVAFAAERAGATRVVLFDGMDPAEEFQQLHRESGSEVTYVQGDLHDPGSIAGVGVFDVVWCAGVIYHSPDPYRQLLHLRHLTRRWLMLGTETIPEVPGLENACVFHPGRSADSFRAFESAYGDRARSYPGMTRPFDESIDGYANMWWGLSPSAVRSMLRYAGFEVREELPYVWSFRDFLAEAVGQPDFIPPLEASRKKGEERLEGLEGASRPAWAPGSG